MSKNDLHLFEASNQWAKRPDDERFWSLDDMFQACKSYADSSKTAENVPFDSLQAVDQAGEVQLAGSNHQARFSNWAFSQICSLVGAPASYLRNLPAAMVATLINHGLKNRSGDQCHILFQSGSSLLARAFTSASYHRVWNWELVRRLRELEAQGWKVPRAIALKGSETPGARQATAEDILATNINIKAGDWIAPAGLYASDHDMFAFMVNDSCRVDDGTEEGLARGVFISNSEVGAASLKVKTFLYRYVCGNHIVWDCANVQELAIRHVGNDIKRYQSKIEATLTKYSQASATGEAQKIKVAKQTIIGRTTDEVLDVIFGKKLLPKDKIESAIKSAKREAEIHGDFSPFSVWGMVQGISDISKQEPFAANRVKLDKAAGQLMKRID